MKNVLNKILLSLLVISCANASGSSTEDIKVNLKEKYKAFKTSISKLLKNKKKTALLATYSAGATYMIYKNMKPAKVALRELVRPRYIDHGKGFRKYVVTKHSTSSCLHTLFLNALSTSLYITGLIAVSKLDFEESK